MGTSLFAFIIVLSVLILFHELGHFIVARLSGVGVEKFSIGFGPRLIGKKIGITDFRISAIPLGGYVKMVGDEPDAAVEPADIPLSFTHKPIWKRILIVAAGPLFNFLLAVLIFFAAFSITGFEDIKPFIRNIEKNGPAMQAGLRMDDRIVSLDGHKIDSWYQINKAVAEGDGKPLSLEAIRDEELIHVSLTPQLKKGEDLFGDEVEYYDIDISGISEIPPVIGEVKDDCPAARAGIRPGDRIVSINGEPTENWREMQKRITASGGGELTITVKRNEKILTMRLVPKLIGEKDHLGKKLERYIIGISTPRFTIPEGDQMTLRLNPLTAFTESIGRTYLIAELTLKGIKKMIEGSVSRDNLGGPIMIAQMAGEQARRGINQLIQFIAFISINLALLNLMPIPVLDGGHLLFFFIEAVTRRPVNMRVREIAQQIGLFLLMLLMVFVFYNDISRFFFN